MSSALTANGDRRQRTWRFRLAVLALSTLGVGVGAEIALRSILFGSGTSATARKLRQAEWYTPGFDADYWKLQARFALEGARSPLGPDARLGWTGDIELSSGAHRDEARLGEREPVLLFGDSFAECATPPEECWQGLFERSEFASERMLLNYGVGGYGLDQIALMIERSLPRFAERNATVLVGVFVDDDLERCALPIRGWPKPWFRFVDGALVLEEPGLEQVGPWLERHPPAIASYALRLLRRAVRGRNSFDTGWTNEGTLHERRALCRAILERIVATLDAHGITRRAFVLFDGEASIAASPRAIWQRDLVREFAFERGIACVSTAPFLLEAIDEDLTRLADFLTPASSPQSGHYDALGNRVAFEAIRQALGAIRSDVALDARASERGLEQGLERVRALRAAGELEPAPESALRYTLLKRPVYCRATRDEVVIRIRDPANGPSRLSLRPGSTGPTVVEIELRGAERMSATLRLAATPGIDRCEGVELTIESGTEHARLELLRLKDPPTALDMKLGGDRVRISVSSVGERRGAEWVVLDDLRFEER